jgi:hypothetical protein
LRAKLRNCGDFLDFRDKAAGFLCNPDCVAEDPVSSEPFSGKFPVTAKNTGKLKRFPPEQLPLNSPKMPFQSHLAVPPPLLMENRTGNSNRHNKDSIGQIKDTTLDKSAKIYKEFDEDLTCKNVRRLRRNNIFCISVS